MAPSDLFVSSAPQRRFQEVGTFCRTARNPVLEPSCIFRIFGAATALSGSRNVLPDCPRSGFETVLHFSYLWCRNGTFRRSERFAELPAIRFWNRPAFFVSLVPQRRFQEVGTFCQIARGPVLKPSCIFHIFGAVTALSGGRNVLPNCPQSGFGTVLHFSYLCLNNP